MLKYVLNITIREEHGVTNNYNGYYFISFHLPFFRISHLHHKGLVLNGLKLEVMTIGENGISEDDILIHDANQEDPTLHQMLARLRYPLVTGVIRSFEDVTLEERKDDQTEMVKSDSKFSKTNELFFSGDTYQVI